MVHCYHGPGCIAVYTALSQSLLVHRCVQGSLAFLQGVYGKIAVDVAMEQLSSPNLPPGDGSIQSRLGHLIQILETYVELFSNISPQEHFDSKVLHTLLGEAVAALGLKPLEVLWMQGPLNASEIIDAVILVAQNNQQLLSTLDFPVNMTDPSVAELEALVFQWLSVGQEEDGLSLPLSLSMADVLLSYSASLNSTDLEYMKVIGPLSNQSSRGVFKVVLQTMQALRQVMEAPGDPSVVILGYLNQMQDFLTSALLEESSMPPALFAELHPAFLETIQLLEGFNMTGDPAAFNTILRHLGRFLPSELLPHYEAVMNQTYVLMGRLSACASAGLDCPAAVSHAF